MHTIEHLFATYARNSEFGKGIVYVGPMGCRTGFYLLTANLEKDGILQLLKQSFKSALEFDEIPGNKREECGNYLDHDLNGAKRECENYLEVLNSL